MRQCELTSVTLIAGVALLLAYSGSDFSYWWDELYSVTAAQLPMHAMFDHLIFEDVHPPLYQIILNVWGTIFGYQEQAMRLLSLLAYVVTTIYSFKLIQLYRLNHVAFFLVCSHPMLLYYAFEVRSYSLLALLSVASFYYHVLGHEKRFLLYLLTSLTHYFGLIMVGALLLMEIWRSIQIRDRRLLLITTTTSLVCLIWPCIHFLNGTISEKTGGNFWIKSDGVVGTLVTFVDAMFPYLDSVYRAMQISEYDDYLSFFLLLFLLTLAFRARCFENILFLTVLCLITVTVIDLFSPISTSRNFIFAAPLVYLVLAKIFEKHSAILLLMIGCNLVYGSLLLSYKFLPLQNPRLAYADLEVISAEVVCVKDAKDIEQMMPLIYNFYNKNIKDIRCKAKMDIFDDLGSYDVIISMHNKLNTADLNVLEQRNYDVRRYKEHRTDATIIAIRR